MMARASISNREVGAAREAFTLVEVIVALGICTITVVAVAGLLAPVTRLGAEAWAEGRAVQLSEPIQAELRRLRDTLVLSETEIRLEVLAGMLPSGTSPDALRLVASAEGRRVMRESEADDPETGLPLRDRYFLIEVRRQAGGLDYTRDAGFLAVTAVVRWPYQLASGPGSRDAQPADLAQASTLVLNFALSP